MNTKTLTPSQSLLPSGSSPSKSDEVTLLPESLSCLNEQRPKRKTWQEILQSKFRYDPETGKLYHLNPLRNQFLIGKEAGILKPNGYRETMIHNTQYLVHRVIWEMHYGNIPRNMQVDHINHIKQDNRLENLRLTTSLGNSRNRSKNHLNKSGIMGVMHRTDRNGRKTWEVQIQIKYVIKYLGRTQDFFEACCLRKSAENKYNFHRNHGKKFT